MSLNLNKTIIAGRLTADPELKQTQSGIFVTTFGVAVDRPYQKDKQNKQADFINIVAWRQTAEFVAKFFRKGSSICVLGSIQTRIYDDSDGKKRYAVEVVADDVRFVESKQQGQPVAPPIESTDGIIPNVQAANYETLITGDDLPF